MPVSAGTGIWVRLSAWVSSVKSFDRMDCALGCKPESSLLYPGGAGERSSRGTTCSGIDVKLLRQAAPTHEDLDKQTSYMRKTMRAILTATAAVLVTTH